MIKVSLINLSPDACQVDAGAAVRGEVDADELRALLDNFSRIGSLQAQDGEPQIGIEGRAGKFIVRTGHGKLFLYDARDSSVPFVELIAEDIVRHVTAQPVSAQPEEAEPSLAPATTRTPHRGIAIAMLLAGLGLNGYTLYSVFYIDDVNQKPAIKLITDTNEFALRQSSVVGRYATGTQPGDRTIIVEPNGRIRFGEVVTAGSRPESTDTYRIGRYQEQLCLTTIDSGIIDVTGLNTLVYYRDTYRRVQ